MTVQHSDTTILFQMQLYHFNHLKNKLSLPLAQQANHFGMPLATYHLWDSKSKVSFFRLIRNEWWHDSECRTIAASLDGSKAQVDWLGSKVCGYPAFALHSLHDSSKHSKWQRIDDSTINIILPLLLLSQFVCLTTQFAWNQCQTDL